MKRNHSRYDTFKRAMDLMIALLGVLLTAPVQLGIALLLLIKEGRPVLFRQTRPGLHGKSFDLLKFRTMRPYNEDKNWVTDRQRLTATGNFLRSSSLDELPSLINVIKGDMSIVGPRPLLLKYINLYTAEQARRHEVRPGITGLAQVRGRNAISWEDKLALDIQYVERRSFLLDVKIILQTVRVVIGRRGVSAPGEATMPEFRGTPANDEADYINSARTGHGRPNMMQRDGFTKQIGNRLSSKHEQE